MRRAFQSRASLYTARNMRATQKAKQAKCDHDFTLADDGRHKGLMVCDHCGLVVPNPAEPREHD